MVYNRRLMFLQLCLQTYAGFGDFNIFYSYIKVTHQAQFNQKCVSWCLGWPVSDWGLSDTFRDCIETLSDQSCSRRERREPQTCWRSHCPPHSFWLNDSSRCSQRFSFRLRPRVNRSTRALQELFAFHMNRSQRAGVFWMGSMRSNRMETHQFWNFGQWIYIALLDNDF